MKRVLFFAKQRSRKTHKKSEWFLTGLRQLKAICDWADATAGGGKLE